MSRSTRSAEIFSQNGNGAIRSPGLGTASLASRWCDAMETCERCSDRRPRGYFAQASFSESVRLKTGLPGVLFLVSGVK